MKFIMPWFNNFSFNHDFNQVCDSLEAFTNQDPMKLKSFVFKVLDLNNDKRISEIDLFCVMQAVNTQSSRD